ncbi:MAG: hypothetical protein F4Y27_11750 [Acidimicrobiaceae bacterium]|nr:hypothetical protein [Acidimicrobiaceae bacterium]MXW74429.1 hypothetical protein [Acidimicrobiaceae bacterium]MYA75336.1 hypothetical protein [Acidimicrobiaceae bacterium]MYC41961.1 hypothetical protein [Acidimicrobiaceae bacterium]MYD08390.1 hypothetical protein [Acidimicrobiaceae bacterium]
MLDHVFTDAIGALRDAFEMARLERIAFEEQFLVDVLLGDVSWQTTYGLPGEGLPPRVKAEVNCVWPTWSQTAYRNWYVDEELSEPPYIQIEIVLRAQCLTTLPDPSRVLSVLPIKSPTIGGQKLTRSGPTIESGYGNQPSEVRHAIEVSYESTYELDEPRLVDGSVLDDHFSALGGWISSTLVQLDDLKLA